MIRCVKEVIVPVHRVVTQRIDEVIERLIETVTLTRQREPGKKRRPSTPIGGYDGP